MNGLDPELVPWSEKAEQSVLGALLNDNNAWDRVADMLARESFFSSGHGAIFETISVLVSSGKPADVVTVFERLQGKAQEVGGLGYLNELAACVPSAAHVRRYAEIVADKALRRALLETADEARGLALGEGETTEIVDACAGLFGNLQQHGQRSQVEGADRVLVGRMDHYNALAEGSVSPGISTGIEDLDKALGGGMRPGKVIVIAARPGVGKTALTLQVMVNAALAGHPGLFLSMEMEKGELMDRCLSNVARIPYSNFITGKFSDQEWGRLAEATDKIGNAPLWFDDAPALTLHDVRAKAASLRRAGLRVLGIDYLQLMRGSKLTSRENRNSQIEEISRGIKQLAREFGLTVLLLSQLSRDVEKGNTPKPVLAHLRDSGSTEQDADVVLMLWAINRQIQNGQLVGAHTPKNRQGKPGTEWEWKFQGYWQRFAKYEVETAHRGPAGFDLEPGGFDN